MEVMETRKVKLEPDHADTLTSMVIGLGYSLTLMPQICWQACKRKYRLIPNHIPSTRIMRSVRPCDVIWILMRHLTIRCIPTS